MAYYIFLKYLRSLEEFRKNPHVKIPPKSPSTNFQCLGKFKNPIFNSEIIFPCFRPGQPCGPRVGRVFVGNTFSFSVHAFPCRPPLSHLSINRPLSIRCVFPTTPADPCCFLPSPPANPRRPTSDLVMPGKTITPRLGSPP
jgi:hypothetical protein